MHGALSPTSPRAGDGEATLDAAVAAGLTRFIAAHGKIIPGFGHRFHPIDPARAAPARAGREARAGRRRRGRFADIGRGGRSGSASAARAGRSR